jgi:uncharacterized protein YndB with AHSA1/START domain
VWRWFVSPEALRQWLSSDLEIDLQVGGRYQLLGADEETWISGTVLELVPESGLVLSWLEEGSGWAHPARLLITLSAIATGTRVSLTHDGFAGIGTPRWRNTMDAYDRGADRHQILQKLADTVMAGSARLAG